MRYIWKYFLILTGLVICGVGLFFEFNPDFVAGMLAEEIGPNAAPGAGVGIGMASVMIDLLDWRLSLAGAVLVYLGIITRTTKRYGTL
jgi:hypothetical protein